MFREKLIYAKRSTRLRIQTNLKLLSKTKNRFTSDKDFPTYIEKVCFFPRIIFDSIFFLFFFLIDARHILMERKAGTQDEKFAKRCKLQRALRVTNRRRKMAMAVWGTFEAIISTRIHTYTYTGAFFPEDASVCIVRSLRKFKNGFGRLTEHALGEEHTRVLTCLESGDSSIFYYSK